MKKICSTAAALLIALAASAQTDKREVSVNDSIVADTIIVYTLKTGKVGEGVVKGYKAIEDGVVGGYKAIENGVVKGYKRIEEMFVQAFLNQEEKVVKREKKDTKKYRDPPDRKHLIQAIIINFLI